MLKDLLNLFYPAICFCCDKNLSAGESVICVHCRHELPITDNLLEPENRTKKIFYGRVPVENAASLLLFEKKGIVQNLIHYLKYRGNQEIGSFLGQWLGQKLSIHTEYQKITVVIPVPLHKRKLRSRGYNQVEKFGKEIAGLLEVPYVDNVLLKTSSSKSQTNKKRFARWGELNDYFIINNGDHLQGAHILLIDDIVTTGATLEACSNKLLEIPNIKISIATMAFAV
ncbi:MAG TPA: ComF family protein [Salinimicrobium sp.]|nr:ComF family protein [Salinimicrobium sp.]